ncbi:hypothetical protein K9L05_01655 [Candidatus Babeliales bacterium]|nr:hypothetical protein [Candidatus Babeliales bacterium]MCF7899337.1 hypothetical protein [Candidatus Babeliales bacterium]
MNIFKNWGLFSKIFFLSITYFFVTNFNLNCMQDQSIPRLPLLPFDERLSEEQREQLAELGVSSDNVFFISKQEQDENANNLDYFKDLKRDFMQNFMNLPEDQKIIQFIGDSRRFGPQATNFLRRLLRNKRFFGGNHVIEYGYTGGAPNQEQSDTNTLINEYINEHPEYSKKVFANIVTDSGTYASDSSPFVHNFIFVYNEDGQPTHFGDDIFVSDYMLNSSDGDSVLCLEGGVQTFLQIVNCLKNNINIFCILNLRDRSRESEFSAARVVKVISNLLKSLPSINAQNRKLLENTIGKIKNICLQGPDLVNLNPDSGKIQMLQRAFNQLINEKLYERIKELCSFYVYNSEE